MVKRFPKIELLESIFMRLLCENSKSSDGVILVKAREFVKVG